MKNAYDYAPRNELIDLGSLNAAGQATEVINLRDKDGKFIYNGFTYQVRLSGVTTNVLLEVQGNLDGSEDGWANLSDDGAQIMLSSDGTYLLQFDNFGECDYTRLYFSSESGGTAAVLAVKARVMGNAFLQRASEV